jgi:basic amino acid/polyamine antiporter, APA family
MKTGQWQALYQAMNRRKSLHQALRLSTSNNVRLERTLSAADLVLYGIGSSVGAGIYVLVGLGAVVAGPAISLSFLVTGAACTLTAVSYAEFAAAVPLTGSAAQYLYVATGEVWAWMAGWNLTLGYGFTTAVVARAWADYLGHFLLRLLHRGSGSTSRTVLLWFFKWAPLGTTTSYTCSPLSTVIVAINSAILLRGVQDSSRFNNFMTCLNIAVLLTVVACGLFSQTATMQNLSPYFDPREPVSATMAGAGLVRR